MTPQLPHETRLAPQGALLCRWHVPHVCLPFCCRQKEFMAALRWLDWLLRERGDEPELWARVMYVQLGIGDVAAAEQTILRLAALLQVTVSATVLGCCVGHAMVCTAGPVRLTVCLVCDEVVSLVLACFSTMALPLQASQNNPKQQLAARLFLRRHEALVLFARQDYSGQPLILLITPLATTPAVCVSGSKRRCLEQI